MARSEPPSGRAPATIDTIATEVGVSVATVSRVLNGSADVAPDTRARIEASLDRHQYSRRYKRQPVRSDQIDLAFHAFGSAWAMEIILGVEDAASAAKVDVVLSQLGGRHRPPQDWLNGVLARQSLGVLFVLANPTPAQQQQLRSRNIPFVVIDPDGSTPASVATVGSNNWNGGLVATRHLLELGHRRIAMISGEPDVLCSQARVAGYRSAHDEMGLTPDPELLRYGAFRAVSGFEHGMELLDRTDRPTAVFAGSDTQAMGVLRAAWKLGLSIPGDLSVVGYDNLFQSVWSSPALTTVDQQLQKMAVLATRMLIDLARGAEVATTRIDMATELIVRESTTPPRG
jgi:DNA-binding LacI/PurR family transcriptional regulator